MWVGVSVGGAKPDWLPGKITHLGRFAYARGKLNRDSNPGPADWRAPAISTILICMQLKTNLHLHTIEDPMDGDIISYSAHQAIDYAASKGFEVLAFTLHNAFYYNEELSAYAAQKNILLIPGIEKSIEGRHVLILNADKQAEQIQTLAALRAYRAVRSDILVIAPHPYYYGNISLKEKLLEQSELFDALEQSWFYKGIFNRNQKAAQAATRLHKPFIATSDLHVLSRLENSYALIETTEKTVSAVLQSIRAGAFKNYSRPASLGEVLSQLMLVFKHPGELSLKKVFFGAKKEPITSVPSVGIEPTSRP